MPRVKQRTPELRGRVLDVAVTTLARDGVTGFTTRKVAQRADTSIPAVYELFGARGGLLREVFFEGFRLLRARLDRLRQTDDPRADLVRLARAVRAFVNENPALAKLMFERPFADFDPGPEEADAGAGVRERIVGGIARWVDQDQHDATDAAHAFVALVHGLAVQETAGWLGTTKASVDRRWRLAVDALLDGLGDDTARPA